MVLAFLEMIMKTPERSWLEYFAWADPATPYMQLFRSIVQVAYVALGGDVVDQCLAAARRMDADYQLEQALPPSDDPAERHKRRPVGHREGAGARRDCFKYEEGGRKRFEQACEMVRKLFRSVLGYDAVIPCEPEDTPEHKPEDPEMVQRIQARAANLQTLLWLRAAHSRGSGTFSAQAAAQHMSQTPQREMKNAAQEAAFFCCVQPYLRRRREITGRAARARAARPPPAPAVQPPSKSSAVWP
jgi:hypothetical protein